jgi:hypothetical protein
MFYERMDLFVCLAAMFNVDDVYDMLVIINGIEHTVIANANSTEMFFSHQFAATGRYRFLLFQVSGGFSA